MRKSNTSKKFGVTPELFLEWRKPRFGSANPTRFDNKVWNWLINSEIDAYTANEEMGFLQSRENDPTWCFSRMGQTSTELPDGRIILISGEHEDSYHPDFYIYNDVVVINPDKSIEIYGYPKDVFPPTDFHTATLIDNSIVILGNLGYPADRIFSHTQIYSLNTENFEIHKIDTIGESPGWLHRHTANISSDNKKIFIQKGELDTGRNNSLIENIDDWELNISNFTWKRLTRKKWTRWEVKRSDNQLNNLWEIRQALWNREVSGEWKKDYEKDIKKLTEKLGKFPEIDLVKDLYKPPIDHQTISQKEDEYAIYRVSINGVTVRYVEDMFSIKINVEGKLPVDIIEKLKADLLEKLSNLENTDYEIDELCEQNSDT